MKRSHLFFVCLLLCALVCATAAQNGTIRGKVRVPSGATLTGVIVELWSSGARTSQAVTTNDGDFIFAGITPANYELVVQHTGYQPAIERVDFRSAQQEGRLEIISVEIILKPAANKSVATPLGTVFAQEVPFAAQLAYEEAQAKLKAGQTDEAVAKLREAVKLFPDYFNAQLALASELSKQDRTQPALEALERARAVNDRDARVYRLFGLLMARQRKFVVAEYAFRKAIERDPTHALTFHSRAVALLESALAEKDQPQRRARLDEAERDLNKALELSGGKSAATYLQRARIHEQRGDKPAAVRDLETYLKLQPQAENAAAVREAIAKLSR